MFANKIPILFLVAILLLVPIMGCEMVRNIFSDPYNLEIVVRDVADVHGDHLKVLVSGGDVIDGFEKTGTRFTANAQLRGEVTLSPQLTGYLFNPAEYKVVLEEEQDEKRVYFNASFDPEFKPEVTLKSKSLRFVNLDILQLQVESWENMAGAEKFVLLRRNSETGSVKGFAETAYTYKPVEEERQVKLAVLDKKNRIIAKGDIPLGFTEEKFELEFVMDERTIKDVAEIQGAVGPQVIDQYQARCTLDYENAPFEGYVDLELDNGQTPLPGGAFVIVNNMAFTTDFAMNESEFNELLTAEYEQAGYNFDDMDLFFYDEEELVDAKTSGEITGEAKEVILAGVELVFPGGEERASARVSYEALKFESEVIFHVTVHEVFGVKGARSFTILDPTQSPTAFGSEISRNNDDDIIDLFILGNAPEGFDEDNGVILISTAEQLDYIREYLNDDEAHFRQVADIDLADYENWQPIGSYRNIFEGSYDGNGFIIRNLSINCTELSDAGLFGFLGSGGELKNITLENVEVTGNRYVGGLLGRNEGTVQDSTVSGNISGHHQFVGGLIGANLGTVQNSSVEGTVTGPDRYVGGLVGVNSGSSGEIKDCFADSRVEGLSRTGGIAGLNTEGAIIRNSEARGEVSGEEQDIGGLVGLNEDGAQIIKTEARNSVSSPGNQIGGLVGRNAYNSDIIESKAYGQVNGYNMVGGLVGLNRAQIKFCEAHGRVDGEDHNIGGLVGLNREDGEIEFSFASGNVNGVSRVGGLVGRNDGEINYAYAEGRVTGNGDNTGGLTGFNSGKIEETYAVGNVSGSGGYVGGLVGFNNSNLISRSYYDMDTTGQNDDQDKGKPRTTEEMMQRDTFEDWNFGDIWDIEEGQGYPFLRDKEVVFPEPDAGQSSATATDNEDGTATIEVIVAEIDGTAITGLEEADFIIYEAGTSNALGIFDSFTETDPGTYIVVWDHEDGTHNVDVEVDNVVVEVNLEVTISPPDYSGFDIADHPGDQVVGEDFKLEITNAANVEGNKLTGVINVTIQSNVENDGHPQEVFDAAVAFSNGIATVEDITLNYAGNHNLTVSVAGVTEDVVVADVTVVPGPPDSFEASEEIINQGEPLEVDFTDLQDEYGNAVADGEYDIGVSDDLTGATFAISDVTFEGGEATDVVILEGAATGGISAGSYDVTFSIGDANHTETITVNQVIDDVSFTVQPETFTEGVPEAWAVTVLDKAGEPVEGEAVHFVLQKGTNSGTEIGDVNSVTFDPTSPQDTNGDGIVDGTVDAVVAATVEDVFIRVTVDGEDYDSDSFTINQD